MEDDLRMAREIQLATLPKEYPSFPRRATPTTSAFQFTTRYFPSGTVGGDFFTITALSDTEAAVFICDVAGHGVRAALVTAMIRALIEKLGSLAALPGEFLTRLNGDLHAILKPSGMPVLTTAFYLLADWRTGRMYYSNAGHPKPFHVQRQQGKVAQLADNSGQAQPALALFEDTRYETSEISIEPRDLIMMFTDGLYEIQSQGVDVYTQEALMDAVQRRINQDAPVLFDELLDEIKHSSADGNFLDDVCIVGMECRGAPVS
jgi:sigma-B regulation protein RsbU (phosphoserine phosphatase)